MIRIGAIGIDTSHFPEFTRRINALADAAGGGPRVTTFYDPGQHQMPAADVAKWRAATLAMGVAESPSIDKLIAQVDAVMVLSLSGTVHLHLATPGLTRGLPTYIDKPMTCDLSQARQILELSRKHNTPCYSASSLRFAVEIAQLDRAALGELRAIDATGPGELNASNPHLYNYGVHTVEMVDAIWGPGVKRVRTTHSERRDLLDIEYHDGRHAHLRLERGASYEFAASVHGTKSLTSFKVGFGPIYDRLVQGMTAFFAGGPAPVPLRDLVENVATMQAGNASLTHNGVWMDVEAVE